MMDADLSVIDTVDTEVDLNQEHQEQSKIQTDPLVQEQLVCFA